MTGAVFVALLAGHLLGDWVVQTDACARNKMYSWWVMAEHILSYHAVMAAFLLPDDAPVAVIRLQAVRGRVLDTARWCPACLLPSAVLIEVLVATTGPRGTSAMFYVQRVSCPDCDYVAEPDPS